MIRDVAKNANWRHAEQIEAMQLASTEALEKRQAIEERVQQIDGSDH